MIKKKLLLLGIIPLLFNFMGLPTAAAFTATGGTITYDGAYIIHTFTTSGTFTVTGAPADVEYLVIGGGGGGGGTSGGGGGAGGFLTASGHAVTAGDYTITVGAGGAAKNDGNDSTFDTITAIGGGKGGTNTAGANGGSGGGGSRNLNVGGTGTGGQGYDGGDSKDSDTNTGGGGGGGAGAVGQDEQGLNRGGAGGAGLSSAISGSTLWYAGGGGGGTWANISGDPDGGVGGTGGGGHGAEHYDACPSQGTAGTANTGSGGGGGGGTCDTGWAGGSGIVVIKYIPTTLPDAVDDLALASVGPTTASLSFSQPNLNGETLVNYMLNMTTPQQGTLPTTFWMNTTSSPFLVTGLTSGTNYSAAASVFSTSGGNWTQGITNILNFTTSSGASTPTGLTATDTSISTIDVDWNDAPAYDNITGYRIFRESPTGNGWTLVVNDTATSTSSYSDTGLSVKTQYNYMVAGINGTGVGSNSTASADYTWGVPDIITGFTITSPTASTLTLDYTAAVPYGYPVTGYMVYRDNTLFSADIGNVTSYVNTGLSAGTSYNYAVKALSAFGNSVSFVNATGITATGPPTGLTVNDCYHACSTQLNLEWVAPVPGAGINGYRIFSESPIGNGFTTLVSNTTTTTLYYNNTGLTPGVFYNYKVAALNGVVSENSTAYARSPHKLPDSVTDLVITPNSLLQFDAAWTAPTLYGTLTGYQINYTTPAGDPVTIYTSTNPGVTAVISGLNPTVEYSFRVAANTYHGINATGNIANATASSEIAVGDLTFDAGINPDVEPIWYENYVVDSTTNDVQVRYDAGLTVDCTVTERISGNVNTYTGLAETVASGYVYHNFTVTNAGNDILDWDCYDQTDSLVNGQYSLTQGDAASGLGGFGNVPLFSQMSNFTDGLYGTEGNFAGIDLITLFIVIVSMLGFNRQNPALGVGVMAIMLGAAWYYELIPWTSGVLGGIAVVVVLAIGQGTKKD